MPPSQRLSVEQTSGSVRSVVLTLVGIVLVALNLRPALLSVSPMLMHLGDTLGLSSVMLGVLTTLPVLCLGIVAPLAPRAARAIGDEQTILWMLLLLAATLLIRPFIGVVGLFAGTAIAGGCIGVMNVLLPGLVKRDFPEHVGVLTGLYTMALSLGSAVAAGVTEPLRLFFDGDWQPALAFWLIPALIAAVIWLPQLRGRATHREATRSAAPRKGLHRDPLAWQVTLYMGLQSSLAYSVFGWLPTILADRGLSDIDAGLALSISILVQLISAMAAPWIGGRSRDQRGVVATVILLSLTGLLGCLYAPIASVWLWALLLGLGQGGSFSIALTLIALRAADAQTAARLSGMAQGVGYILAALGPLLVGVLHDVTGGWDIVGGLFVFIVFVALIAGMGAGRTLLVGKRSSTSY